MASNPRKFSEKIALHNQKQAEETAAFEQIMKEVGNAKTPTLTENGDCTSSNLHLGIGSISTFRAGSLPNVNSPSANPSIDLQSALHNLEEMRSGRESGYRDRRSAGPGGGGFNPQSASARSSRQVDSSPRRIDHHSPSSPNHTYNNAHQLGNMGPPIAGSINNTPTSSVMTLTSSAYLSPPLDPSWRRTHSDSALHQATQLAQDGSLHTHGASMSPTINRRTIQEGPSGLQGGTLSDSSSPLTLGVGSDGRPKSCCDVSRVPGINICPGPEPNGIQIPIGNNTGSLPDLTNLQFSSPLSNPLDFEDPSSHHNQTLYCTSPTLNAGPNLGAASSFMGPVNTINTVSIGLNPGHVSSRGSSPGPSPSTRRRPHHQLQNLVLGSSTRSHHGHSNQQQNHSSSPNHLTIPTIVVNSRLLHSSKGIALDPNGMPVPSYQPFYQQRQPQHQQHSRAIGSDFVQSVSPTHSPIHMMSTSQPTPSHGQYLTAYQNVQPLLRPSPQSSPTLVVPGNMNYRSNSPGDSNCFNSAPPSPVSQSLSPASSPGLAPSPASPFTDQSSQINGQLSSGNGNQNTSTFTPNPNAFFQQFAQFTMMDSHSEQQQPQRHNYGNYNKVNQFGQGNMDLSLDSYYTQPSNQFFGNCGAQQTAPQTPQTPSSIPDIVLQDFSSTSEDLTSQGLAKELSSAMGTSFDGVDFFPTDDALRDGLVPIDLYDLQMLSESSVVMDPSTEEHFRLDRL